MLTFFCIFFFVFFSSPSSLMIFLITSSNELNLYVTHFVVCMPVYALITPLLIIRFEIKLQQQQKNKTEITVSFVVYVLFIHSFQKCLFAIRPQQIKYRPCFSYYCKYIYLKFSE